MVMPNHKQRYRPIGRDDDVSDPWCSACATDDYLIIEEVEPAEEQNLSGHPLWNISYSCAECESFYGHQTRKPWLGEPDEADWLVAVESAYIHCGEPMRPFDSAQRPIYDPVLNHDPEDALPHVEVDTLVLRCACGFQIAVPAESYSEGN
ncbi:hypothetical protein [Arthrobacter crystallopoietes]|uniref:hypothetical protein n=1 Tax=Crystallibacter crystallopoietes TaxID=37928 RepID=UPI0011115E60|nr:hypothetical protein [Arthrobacter crystallopoietes]